jgi:DNA-binding NarL/FixJ family response regulator
MPPSQPPKQHPSRILVVEDHFFFRQGLVDWINRQPDLACCGNADSCAAARKAAADLKPDLVLLDLGLKDENGLDLLKQLKAEFPALRILVISQGDEAIFAERALRAGAMGYLMKEEIADEVLRAIRHILWGEIYLSSRMATQLLRRSLAENLPPCPAETAGRLSDREMQVVQLIGVGLPNARIAAKLGISVKTVETHRENIKNKLNLADASALAHFARTWLHSQNGQPSP